MRGPKPQPRPMANAIATAINPPSWLSKHAKHEWRRVMPEIVKRRTLTDADLGGLENYCVAIGRVRQLEALLLDSVDPKLFRMQDAAIKTSRQLAAELGLTPVSRSRPAVRKDDDDGDANPLNIS